MDMGGPPALALAALQPHRVGRVVVMNSLVLGDAPTSWEIAVLRGFGTHRIALEHLPRIVFERCLQTFLDAPLEARVRDDLWWCFQRASVRRTLSRMCSDYERSFAFLPALYRHVQSPTLLLWGERDPHFPPAQASSLHALLPDARLEVLPGAGHWMVWSRAPEVADRMAAFLAADRGMSGTQYDIRGMSYCVPDLPQGQFDELEAFVSGPVDAGIRAFLEHTARYRMQSRVERQALPLAWLTARLGNLHLPADGAWHDVDSVILPADGDRRVWIRTYRDTGQIAYVSIYGAAPPDSIVELPLPFGTLRSVMRLAATGDGGLRIASRGMSFAGLPLPLHETITLRGSPLDAVHEVRLGPCLLVRSHHRMMEP